MNPHRLLLLGFWILLAAAACPAGAQPMHRGGVELSVQRAVQMPAGRGAAIVVVDFFHHGAVAQDGGNVLAFARNRAIPTRVLQVGPGDYCRVAFQTVPNTGAYEVLYGGEKLKPEANPPWTAAEGLLLETRRYKQCDLSNVESLRQAFEAAAPIGADYVESVRQSGNPCALHETPFLSRYSGTLKITNPGNYGFFTSSQDASFLLVDGKTVIAAPGLHGPAYDARPGSRGDIALSAGPHKFEYYHAAAGPSATMVAAWAVNPTDPKTPPAPIPPEVFSVGAVARGEAGPPSMQGDRPVPDFRIELTGFVPLPDNPVPLVGTRLVDRTARSATSGAKLLWEFGDGQTSERLDPVHVYLRPGEYTIKLSVRRGGSKPLESASRVEIAPPRMLDAAKFPQLDDYLPILETYDTRAMPSALLLAWIEAFLAKAEALAVPEDKPAPDAPAPAPVRPAKVPGRPGAKAGPKVAKPPIRPAPKPPTPPVRPALSEEQRAELAQKYFQLAVDGGRAALVEESAATGTDDLLRAARRIGPVARDRLGNSSAAGSIWQGASRRITTPEGRAECLVEAADVLVNDLVNAAAARTFLDAAEKLLAAKTGAIAAKYQRVRGDYCALTGDGAAARKAYSQAESLLGAGKTHIERTAWQGAHGRSTEEFLKSGDLPRAAEQLRQWQDEFPADKITGYLTLVTARYWAARKKYPQAIALAGQLAAVNADSPYADALQLLAAQCHHAGGDQEKAAATLRNMIKNYPGSPLTPEAKQLLKRWEPGPAKPAAQKGNPP